MLEDQAESSGTQIAGHDQNKCPRSRDVRPVHTLSGLRRALPRFPWSRRGRRAGGATRARGAPARREGEDGRAGSGTKYEVDERHVLRHTGAVALPGTCFHAAGNGERPSEPASIRGDTGQGGLGPEKTRGQARRRPRGREDAFNTRVRARARPIHAGSLPSPRLGLMAPG